MFIKERIEEYMKAREWTAYRLAKEAKIGVSTLYEILNGKKKNPSADTLSKIAGALGVSVNDFFSENEVETEYKELLSKISKLDDSKKQLIKNLINEFEKTN